MMTLGWPSYLIHGTNKPYGVGMRSSHGCMRFYPEDIAELYDDIPIGTKVTVVNQPFVFGWHNDAMFAQAFPVMEDDEREHPQAADALLNAAISNDMWQKVKEHNTSVDLELVNTIVAKPRGIAIPVSKKQLTFDKFIYLARHVENDLPEGSTWNGKEELLVSTEEFEAARSGNVLPAKPPAAKKPIAKKPAAVAKKPAVPAAAGSATPPKQAFDVEKPKAVTKPVAATPAKPVAKPVATTANTGSMGGAPKGSR
jgi:L,D-transpeptidase ErfK/SrfK